MVVEMSFNSSWHLHSDFSTVNNNLIISAPAPDPQNNFGPPAPEHFFRIWIRNIGDLVVVDPEGKKTEKMVLLEVKTELEGQKQILFT